MNQTDPEKRPLDGNRIKFGVASILHSRGLNAFSPIHTMIIRLMGGSDVHLGIVGALILSLGNVMSWVGTLILEKSRTHRTAMLVVLVVGLIAQAFTFGCLYYGSQAAHLPSQLILIYISLVGIMAICTGALENIQLSWIGELVKHSQRGWFVSGLSIISNLGLVSLQLFFAKVSRDMALEGFAWLVAILIFNSLLAIFLVATITDRPEKTVQFIKRKGATSITYRLAPMWGLIGFESLWRCGRISLMTFSTAYMLDHFGYKMDTIILIHMIVNAINIGMLFYVGPLSDRIGIFKPLAIISSVCAFSMFLWVSSVWWGIIPIILYQLINGAAGTTHFMLLNNLALQLYPSIGRPNYLSFARTVVGVVTIIASISAGYLLSQLRGWKGEFLDTTVDHYLLFFSGCTLVTLFSLVPLAYIYFRTGRASLVKDE